MVGLAVPTPHDANPTADSLHLTDRRTVSAYLFLELKLNCMPLSWRPAMSRCAKMGRRSPSGRSSPPPTSHRLRVPRAVRWTCPVRQRRHPLTPRPRLDWRRCENATVLRRAITVKQHVEPEYLTVAEVARIARCSTRTVRRAVSAGRLRSHQPRGRRSALVRTSSCGWPGPPPVHGRSTRHAC